MPQLEDVIGTVTGSVPERRLPACHSHRSTSTAQRPVYLSDGYPHATAGQADLFIRRGSVPERRLPACHSYPFLRLIAQQVYLSDGYPHATADSRRRLCTLVVYLSDGYPHATAVESMQKCMRRVYLSDGYPHATASVTSGSSHGCSVPERRLPACHSRLSRTTRQIRL